MENITPQIEKLLRSPSDEDNGLGLLLLSEKIKSCEYLISSYPNTYILGQLYKLFNGVGFYKYANVHYFSVPRDGYLPKGSYYTFKEKWKNILS